MASTYINPHGLSPLLACRLIALDKNPGVRPIGIGETSRRIISKAILMIMIMIMIMITENTVTN